MKFNCGPTADQKRKNKYDMMRAWIRAHYEWHEYFAWLPVRVADDQCVWFVTVERKLSVFALDYALNNIFDYYKPIIPGRWEYREKE